MNTTKNVTPKLRLIAPAPDNYPVFPTKYKRISPKPPHLRSPSNSVHFLSSSFIEKGVGLNGTSAVETTRSKPCKRSRQRKKNKGKKDKQSPVRVSVQKIRSLCKRSKRRSPTANHVKEIHRHNERKRHQSVNRAIRELLHLVPSLKSYESEVKHHVVQGAGQYLQFLNSKLSEVCQDMGISFRSFESAMSFNQPLKGSDGHGSFYFHPHKSIEYESLMEFMDSMKIEDKKYSMEDLLSESNDMNCIAEKIPGQEKDDLHPQWSVPDDRISSWDVTDDRLSGWSVADDHLSAWSEADDPSSGYGVPDDPIWNWVVIEEGSNSSSNCINELETSEDLDDEDGWLQIDEDSLHNQSLLQTPGYCADSEGGTSSVPSGSSSTSMSSQDDHIGEVAKEQVCTANALEHSYYAQTSSSKSTSSPPAGQVSEDDKILQAIQVLMGAQVHLSSTPGSTCSYKLSHIPILIPASSIELTTPVPITLQTLLSESHPQGKIDKGGLSPPKHPNSSTLGLKALQEQSNTDKESESSCKEILQSVIEKELAGNVQGPMPSLISGFQLFSKVNNPRFKQAWPKLDSQKISPLLGQAWNDLPASLKEIYNQSACSFNERTLQKHQDSKQTKT